jgi:hypothetical protein
MKTYYVLWIYLGLVSELTEVQAPDPLQAVEIVASSWGKDFRDRAAVYVFDSLPVLTLNTAK